MKFNNYLIGIILISVMTYFPLNLSSQEIWGMTSAGGLNGAGVIFKADTLGEIAVMHNFSVDNNIKFPNSSLCLASNGKLYGVTRGGGTTNGGVLFEFDAISGEVKKRFDFDPMNGALFSGSLIDLIELNDRIYGCAKDGGSHYKGVMFEFEPATGQFIKKVDFDGTNGSYPRGNLIKFNNMIYGLTGTSIYEFNPQDSSIKTIYSFDGTIAGSPNGSIVLLNDKIYGTANKHGVNFIFEFDLKNNQLTKKYEKITETDIYPGILTVVGERIFGTSMDDGISHKGTLFEFLPVSGTVIKKRDFNDINVENPYSIRYSDVNGKIYGSSSHGGIYDSGVIFEYDPESNTLIKKFDFGGKNGRNPLGGFAFLNGKLYGMSESGGNNAGVIFEYSLENSKLETRYTFYQSQNGNNPDGGLTELNGKFFGATPNGGKYSCGTIFEFDPKTNIFTKKYDFDGINGSNPVSNMIILNGRLYGITSKGGTLDKGTIFEFDPSIGLCKKLSEFDGLNGSIPIGNLMFLNNKFYGTTWDFTTGEGVLFEMDLSNNKITKKIDLYRSVSNLVELNGKLYGLTKFIFEYDPSNGNFSEKIDLMSYDFNCCTSGEGSSLVKFNGKLYGIGNSGGLEYGILFEYDPISNKIINTINFEGSNGKWPSCILTEYNGKLFGSTSRGNNLFSYDPQTATIKSFAYFNGTNGSTPLLSKLYVTDSNVSTTQLYLKNRDFEIYPNPSFGLVNISNKNLNFQNLSVEVVNPTGEILYQNEFSSNQIEIDLRNHSNGMYLIKITSGNEMITKKIILKK